MKYKAFYQFLLLVFLLMQACKQEEPTVNNTVSKRAESNCKLSRIDWDYDLITDFNYTDNLQLHKRVRQNKAGYISDSITFDYNAKGQIIRINEYFNAQPVPQRIQNLTYNFAGLLIKNEWQAIYPGNIYKTIEFTDWKYDATGNLTDQYKYSTQSASPMLFTHIKFTINAAGNISKVEYLDQYEKLISVDEYEFDTKQNYLPSEMLAMDYLSYNLNNIIKHKNTNWNGSEEDPNYIPGQPIISEATYNYNYNSDAYPIQFLGNNSAVSQKYSYRYK